MLRPPDSSPDLDVTVGSCLPGAIGATLRYGQPLRHAASSEWAYRGNLGGRFGDRQPEWVTATQKVTRHTSGRVGAYVTRDQGPRPTPHYGGQPLRDSQRRGRPMVSPSPAMVRSAA